MGREGGGGGGMEWVKVTAGVYNTLTTSTSNNHHTSLCTSQPPHKHSECTYEKSPAANFASAREKPASFIISPMSDLL